MQTFSQERLSEKIQLWADKYGNDRRALLPVLQEVQREYSHIPDHAMQDVAHTLDIHPVEVYGVVSFYSYLSTKPRGRFIIRLCRTMTCEMLGRKRVARQLENDLGIKFGEMTRDGKFSLEWTNCLGMCDRGPALLVNEDVFTHVTPQKVHEILDECRRTFASYSIQRHDGGNI